MKMTKKIMATLLVAAMTMGGVSVYAESATDLDALKETEVKVTGKAILPIIDVTLPTGGTFEIDPYNVGKQGQIASTELTVENMSQVDVKVSVTKWATTEKEGDVKLVQAIPTGENTDKEVFMYMLGSTKITGEGTEEKPYVATYSTFNASKDAKKVVEDGLVDGGVEFGTLKQATYTKGENGSYDASSATPATGNAGVMKLKFAGNVNTNAKWAEADKLEVTPTFSIVPVANPSK